VKKYPVSKKCPQCHGMEFTRAKPERPIEFADDRVCKTCGTRYTPPTPLWAAVLFFAIGVLILLVDILVVWSHFTFDHSFLRTLQSYVILLGTFSTGVGCIVYGVRRIRRQEDVTSDDAPGTVLAQSSSGILQPGFV
jgi:hypothetical protein